MVDVPVKYEHTLCTLGLSGSRRYSRVVEEAKSHGHPALRVVTWGSRGAGGQEQRWSVTVLVVV